MKEGFLALFIGAIETLGETKLIEVLQKLHDKDKVKYQAAIIAGFAFVRAVKPMTDGTATKIDDLFLNGLLDAIEASAELNGMSPEVPR